MLSLLDDAKVGLKMWHAYFEWVEKKWLKGACDDHTIDSKACLRKGNLPPKRFRVPQYGNEQETP